MLTLKQTQSILDYALKAADTMKLKPLSLVILDERGSIKGALSQDGVSFARHDVAYAKAYGALGLGVGGQTLQKMAKERPHFMNAMGDMLQGRLMPVPGGVLIENGEGDLIGAMGISGDASENDEVVAINAIQAVELIAKAA